MAGILYRLGRFSARRRWTVIITWGTIIAVALVAYFLFKGPVSPSITVPGTATTQVTDELEHSFPAAAGGSGNIVFQTKDGRPFTPVEKSEVAHFLSQIGKLNQVRAATNPFAAQDGLDKQKQQLVDATARIAEARAQLETAQQQVDSGDHQAAAQGELDSKTASLNSDRTTTDLNAELEEAAKNIRFVSVDGSAAIGSVHFTKATYEVSPTVKHAIVQRAATGLAGLHVYVTDDIAQGVPNLVGPGEIIGLLVALIVLLLVLTTFLGAGLPLLSALAGIIVSVLGVSAFSSIVHFTSVTTILGVMLGLAVGIDYSLFILNRHRTQLNKGMPVHESIGTANGTSGNAVLFAGATVIVALLALNVTRVPFLGLMGTVGAISVAVSILVATTLTPALLSLVGLRILRKGERRNRGAATGADSLPVKPMKTSRAVITLVAGVAALVIVALPALGMRLGLPDGSLESTSSSPYKAFSTIATEFGAGQNGPLLVVADLPRHEPDNVLLKEEVDLSRKISAQEHVSAVAPIGTSTGGDVVAFQVVPSSGPSSVATENLVHRLRALTPVRTEIGNVDLGVAGNASANIDVSDKLSAVLPLYLLVVVGLSLMILVIAFRSIIVPLTATAGFVLSLFAAFGGLTAVYQDGWLGDIFGVHDPAPILSFLPIIEVGVLFGLAMDYQLFLVSGMREAYRRGESARVAVQRGVRAGRAVVTAAAIIMASVFSGFIFADSSTVRPIGFGLAFGVLIDAFVVRLLLIPAAMHLLGRTAWWFPKWLDRIVPDVDVEGSQLPVPVPEHPLVDVEDLVGLVTERAPEQGRALR